MEEYIKVIAGFVLGIVIGWLIPSFRRCNKKQLSASETDIYTPLQQSEYEKRMEKSDELYHAAMSQYDKLVPWAAGGSLVLSFSFVSSFANVAPPNSKWILGIAWVSLVLALLSSIFSQYFSTRIQVWNKKILRSRLNAPEEKSSEYNRWREEIACSRDKVRRSGYTTKCLNILAEIFLILGLIFLGIFAIVAVPFEGGTAL